MEGNHLIADLDAFLATRTAELVEFRRDLHAHPEPGYREYRTTRMVAERLTAAGLRPVVLPGGTGLLADVGGGAEPDPTSGGLVPSRRGWGDGQSSQAGGHRGVAPRGKESPPGETIALRADLDALPMMDDKEVPYRSTVPGICHACGHDVHTAVLVGTGLFLAEQAAAGLLPGRVRLIFQPAEEMGAGARDVIAADGLASVGRIFALHCDPRLDVGKVGVRSGAITAACDKIKVTVTGPGGHTARPHLTADVVYALGKIVTELPAALSRRVDPRSGLSLVWGRINAGSAANAIPDEGIAEGTVRCLDEETWHSAAALVEDLVRAVATAYQVTADLEYLQKIPPTVNDETSVAMLSAAAAAVLGPEAVTHTPQSLGGEDFAWYLSSVPGALARLGTRTPGTAESCDLHQPAFDVDERAIGVGVRVLAATALTALWRHGSAVTATMPEAAIQ
jgi:amidohydrolase